MTAALKPQIVAILGDPDGRERAPHALDALLPVVYDDLRAMARRRLRHEGGAVTLTTTELVHEAYLRLAGATQVTARGRAYFFAAAAQAMRRIVVDHARRRRRLKRRGDRVPLPLELPAAPTDLGTPELLDLERGLVQLERIAERAARVVECRFYAGLDVAETALALGVTPRTVNRDWAFARAWLYDYLTSAPGGDAA